MIETPLKAIIIQYIILVLLFVHSTQTCILTLLCPHILSSTQICVIKTHQSLHYFIHSLSFLYRFTLLLVIHK